MVKADASLGKHALTFDVLYDSARNPNVNVDTPQPQFTGAVITDVRKYLFKDTWVISSRFVNEYRMSYYAPCGWFRGSTSVCKFSQR